MKLHSSSNPKEKKAMCNAFTTIPANECKPNHNQGFHLRRGPAVNGVIIFLVHADLQRDQSVVTNDRVQEVKQIVTG